MKQTEDQIKAYKEMASNPADTMESQIRAYLESNCQKFIADKMERCLEHLYDCAYEILEGKIGEIPNKVCFRICQDYFDDEMWKKEDEQKAKEEAERKAREAKAAQKAKDAKVKTGDMFKSTIDDVPEPKECPRCKTKVYYLYDGLCSTCKAKADKEKNNPQLSLF